MPVFYQPIDLAKNELRNAVVQNLGSAPASPIKGQLYMDSTANILYWYNGAGWVAAQGGAGAVPATTVTTQAIGDAGTVGVATTYAREDHKHGEPAFGSPTTEQTFGTTSAAGSATTVARSDHTHGNPNTNGSATGLNIPGALSSGGSGTTASRYDHSHGWGAATGSLDMGSQKIINLADPTNAQDGASKNYVDNLVAGLAWKDSCRVASAIGVNVAAITGLIAIDGVTVAAGDRVLLKDQTTANQNGIYVAASGAWTRATDADLGTEVQGMAVFVEEGTTMADTAWTCTTNAPITVGTTSLTFVQFAGGGAVTAGAGLTQSGNTINVIAGDTSLTVAADSMIVNTGVIATVASVTAAVTGMAKKFAAALTGTASPETVTHNLNTRDIMLTVLNGGSPYTAVEVDWDATTVNTATVRYNPNLGAGYRCVVVG